MIKIYTSYNKLKCDYPDIRIIDDNDSFFEEEEDGETGIDSIDFALMKAIDRVIFNESVESVDYAKSPFGPVKVFDLSTGCKTAINLHHAIRQKKKIIISLTECGENAVLECFKLANNEEVILLLQHGYIIGIKEKFEFLINGEIRTTDIDELSDYAAMGDYGETY